MTTTPTTTPAQLLDQALEHAGRGWHVFPLRPNSKKPAVTAWPIRATTHTGRIQRCWTPRPGNPGMWGIGIATGPSALVVIDLDQPKPHTTPTSATATATATSSDDPEVVTGADHFAALVSEQASHHRGGVQTFTVATASGGTHLYYAAPAGSQLRNTAGRLGPLIDTRAQGGYVVAPGTTINQTTYTVLEDRPVTPLPAWLAALLDPTPPAPPHRTTSPRTTAVPLTRANTPTQAGTRQERFVTAAITGEIARVAGSHEGGRNHALTTAAYNLGQLVASAHLQPSTVTDALTGPALEIGLSPTEVAATIASGLTAGATNPRTTTNRTTNQRTNIRSNELAGDAA